MKVAFDNFDIMKTKRIQYFFSKNVLRHYNAPKLTKIIVSLIYVLLWKYDVITISFTFNVILLIIRTISENFLLIPLAYQNI